MDYVWCKLGNKRLLLFESNSSDLTLEKNIMVFITQDKVIESKLKAKIFILVDYS